MSKPKNKQASQNKESPPAKLTSWRLVFVCGGLLLALAFPAWKSFRPDKPAASDVADAGANQGLATSEQVARRGSNKNASNLSLPASDAASLIKGLNAE